MIYTEKIHPKINAYKFMGEITEELKKKGFQAPNAFQVNTRCNSCGKTLQNHALYGIGDRFQVICPDNYIIESNNGIQIMSSKNFEEIYRPLPIEDCQVIDIKNKED